MERQIGPSISNAREQLHPDCLIKHKFGIDLFRLWGSSILEGF